MAKDKKSYVCDNCGYDSPKWIGKCPSCGQWNSFKEVKTYKSNSLSKPSLANTLSIVGENSQKPMQLNDIPSVDEQRIDMGDSELNRVLGGGLVPGSIVLLGGEPGIGKSTLTLQTILQLSSRKVLYISGEESASQLKMRALRLAARMKSNTELPDNVLIFCDTILDNIMSIVETTSPDLIIVDSIQTIATPAIESSPGSTGQIRECTAQFLRLAKQTNIPIILIGHITKDGLLAGPKILEHMVDAVIQFEGDQKHIYRILRAVKNRFGNTAEIGIYEMQQSGLRPVVNPSELLLGNHHDNLSGISVASAVEGIRPLMIETQALVSTAAYGTPQRSATGFDQRRLNMLLAVLEKRVGFKLIQKDVFVNIAGGLRTTDTSVDLAIIASVLSSHVDTPIEQGWCLAGEVGLSGEVRQVARLNQRVAEAHRLGFTNMIVPASLQGVDTSKIDIHLHPVNRVEEALRLLFG